MNIYINEELVEFSEKADGKLSLVEALQTFNAQSPYAILLNDEFLPQSAHESTYLNNDDKVDVVSAIQGG